MGTRLYIPFAEVNPQVVEAAPEATWVDVSGSPTAYFEALCEWWGRGESFIVLEHDVLWRPDIAEQFDACPELWCSFGYDNMCCQDETGYSPCQEAWANQLGCTRFRSELITAVPDAVTSIPPGPLRDWHELCDGLGGWHEAIGATRPHLRRDGSLRAAGFTHHWHTPHVAHHPWFVSR